MRRETKFKIIFTCSECNGTNIQVKSWTDPNNSATSEWALNDKNADTWCDDCQEHTGWFNEILV